MGECRGDLEGLGEIGDDRPALRGLGIEITSAGVFSLG